LEWTTTSGGPYGGILDPVRGVWSELPNVPEPSAERGAEFGAGVLTRTRLVGGSPRLLVLDVTRNDWIRVPRLWRNRSTPHGWTTSTAGASCACSGARDGAADTPTGSS
jgi:hypothetical protein